MNRIPVVQQTASVPPTVVAPSDALRDCVRRDRDGAQLVRGPCLVVGLRQADDDLAVEYADGCWHSPPSRTARSEARASRSGSAPNGPFADGAAGPATIGVLDGEIVVGLVESELARFDAAARKVGPRDVAAAAVQGAVGATTVGGTLAVCRAARIRFMATGGLGGVHRGWPAPPDVSADLDALARTPALVVSSGVKSLLDVPATAELLETLGVPVLGWRTDELPLSTPLAAGRPYRPASNGRRGGAGGGAALGSSEAADSCWDGRR